MSVSSQECWQNAEVSRSVVSAEILPQLRMELGPGEENAMKKSVKLTRN